MTVPKSDQHREYTRYAAHCLEMVPVTKDQDARAINREMAAEWLRLADSVWRRPRFRQMQME
jgi:hypothetical protein